MQAGWHSMKNFWRARVPLSYKRAVLIARVYNAALSAMTSFVLPESYHNQVNKQMGKYMRSITRERCGRTETTTEHRATCGCGKNETGTQRT